MPSTRVVVTGLGATSPVGGDVVSTWQAMLAGTSGVGYLDDGTMVVVEGGRKLLGETAAVEVTSVLQSPSGKMIFTKVSSSTDAE